MRIALRRFRSLSRTRCEIGPLLRNAIEGVSRYSTGAILMIWTDFWSGFHDGDIKRRLIIWTSVGYISMFAIVDWWWVACVLYKWTLFSLSWWRDLGVTFSLRYPYCLIAGTDRIRSIRSQFSGHPRQDWVDRSSNIAAHMSINWIDYVACKIF